MIPRSKKRAAQKGFGLQIRSVRLIASTVLLTPLRNSLLIVPIQTTSNACASVALLNIVNNIEGLELGDNLQHFKDFTMPFTPALRGDAISNFDFVKRIHNSFARLDFANKPLVISFRHEECI
ncbi:unnamed protein product [Aspergillus oryzae]|uniref:ubiquitinyl hydrolase 1 n=1 Tax=Aspergillus oryzae var. brunneus TaxID=332754 RepID=A0ABQ6KE93_ASPOZ|nr:unnamed protein product [Aspergillus oryzae]GMG41179.1 unnamed protein product [Aspergillus oryzae var. brunneus]